MFSVKLRLQRRNSGGRKIDFVSIRLKEHDIEQTSLQQTDVFTCACKVTTNTFLSNDFNVGFCNFTLGKN